ncbi:MAG: sugar phosphate isomerase/epimerase [Opitutus sp.]
MAYSRTFSTLGSPELSLEQSLALAAKHQLPGIEVRVLSGTIDVPTCLASAYGTPAALAQVMQTQPARIISLDTSLKLAGSTPADREAFLKFLPWAEALGVTRLRVFDGGHTADAATHREMAGTVTWWREQRAQHRWQADIMVETHDALFSAEAIHQFLALAPGTAILWDTHHTWKKGGENPLATWASIRPHVAHVHVKDSVSISSGKHPFTYRLPGDGEFPMSPLRPVLQAEYTGPVSLEWERMWHPYLGPVDEALTVATQRGWW